VDHGFSRHPKPRRDDHARMKLKRPVLTVVVAGLLLFVAIIAVWRSSLASANKDRLSAIAARGEPTSFADLDKFYKAAPESSNAALFWLKGKSALANNPGDIVGKLSTKRGVALNQEHVDETAAFLAANTEALALFHQAARLDQSRYPVTLSYERFTNVLEHLGEMKGAARVLRAQAAVAIAQTNTVLASLAISGIFAASRSMAGEPFVISQLVGYAIDAIGVQTLEFALNAARFTDSELAAMQEAISKADDPERAARGLIGERVFFITGLKDPAKTLAAARQAPPSGFEDIVHEMFVFPITRATGFWERDLRFGIDTLTTNIAFARLPDPDRVHSATNSSVLAARAKRGYYIMSGLLLPALEKFVLRDANHRGLIRTALAGVAIERYRLAHNGDAPPDLLGLVPAYLDKVPVDPYDGLSIRYKRTSGGYMVYSIGPDAKDDGGIEPPAGSKPKALWDVTFIVERPLPKTKEAND
jgi:hypothetical protein